MEIKTLDALADIAKEKPKKYIAVAAAEDMPVLEAVADARRTGIAEPILVGKPQKIKDIAEEIKFSLAGVEIISEDDPAAACRTAAELVREDKAQILMKGMVSTADYLRAVLNKDSGLRKAGLLSHTGIFEIKAYHKIIGLTDAAQNIAPELSDKVEIIKNAVDFFRHLGVETPKVACLAAIEGVNPKMPPTTDAALLTMMNKRKQIKNCIVDGPLAFDNAVSKEAAEHKGIDSETAGDADILMAPNIEVANVLYKSFTYFAGASVAAIILGAACPVVLTSRADSEKSKFLSIAIAAAY